MCLLAEVLPSVFVSLITIGVPAGAAELVWAPSLTISFSSPTCSIRCFTMISNNVFRGEFWTCNDREISYRRYLLCICTTAAAFQLWDLPYFFCRDPQRWESASDAICCWYWPLCVDVPPPYKQLSSWAPEQHWQQKTVNRCFTHIENADGTAPPTVSLFR